MIDNNDNNKRKKNKIKRDGDGDYGLIHWKWIATIFPTFPNCDISQCGTNDTLIFFWEGAYSCADDSFSFDADTPVYPAPDLCQINFIINVIIINYYLSSIIIDNNICIIIIRIIIIH